MKKNLLIITLFLVVSCQQQKTGKQEQTAHSSIGNQSDVSESFEKEKDESCDTEEDFMKKVEEAKKKGEGLKLQGADSGCSTDN